MYAFQINATDRKLVSYVLGCCGSLCSPHPYWEDDAPLARLLSSLAAEEIEAAVAAADKLVEEAVPEEGDPHPQRATVEAQVLALCFTTPGGVLVELTASSTPNEWIVRVDFGRDSQVLAMQMFMVLADFNANLTVGIRETEEDTRYHWDRAGRALARLLLRRDAESDHGDWSGVYGRPVPITVTI